MREIQICVDRGLLRSLSFPPRRARPKCILPRQNAHLSPITSRLDLTGTSQGRNVIVTVLSPCWESILISQGGGGGGVKAWRLIDGERLVEALSLS